MSFEQQENRLNNAIDYFEAFINGDLDNVHPLFSEIGTISVGPEPPKNHIEFFPETAEFVEGVSFDLLDAFYSPESGNVALQFNFVIRDEDGNDNEVNGIDIIEFDDQDKIVAIKVMHEGV